VVQRIPVKIAFVDPPDPKRPLRTGMSVNAVVDLD
jgi:multidrug resistance efflux pump